MASPMSLIGHALTRRKTQTNGEENNIQTNSPILDQRVGGLPPDAIDIVREEIAGAFRDKFGVSIVPGGSHIGDLIIASLTVSHTHRGP